MAIILLAFAPVFALTGQEGKLFHPLAFTKTLAVLAATFIAVTLVPVLCTLLLGGKFHAEEDNPVMRGLRRIYRPALAAALAHRAITIGLAALLFGGALLVGRTIGSEFMPQLNEGDLMFMPIADPSIGLEENTEIAKRQNAALMKFPEVEYVVAKVARAETSTDPAPLNMTETIVHLRPREQWRSGMTLDRLRAEMGDAAQLPGVANIWTMPIVNRIDMLTTGIRSEVGVKIYGADLQTLEDIGRRVAEVVRTVPGVGSVYPEQVTSGQYLNISVDRGAAARHGLRITDVQQVVENAIGETVLSTTIEGRQRFPVRVRYAPEFRADAQALGQVLVTSPSGAQVPLAEVARLEHARGPAMISSENGLLLATVLLNVQGRDVGGFVDEARAVVAREVSLPAGYYMAWSGRWENQEHARQRLQIVIPIVLVVIFVLLYFTYHSALEAAHVLLAVPFALSGGIYLLWLFGYNFSVAVWVGFIALFGTAVQTGVVMVIYLEEAVDRKRNELGGALTLDSLRDAVMEGALLRLRPKIMTVSTVVAGLLPIMWSTSVGAEVMKPLATPVLGGMVSSLVHVLIVTPVIFFWLRQRQLGLRKSVEHTAADHGTNGRSRSPWRFVAGAVAMAVVAGAGWTVWQDVVPRGARESAPAADMVRTIRSAQFDVVLRAPGATLRRGRNTLTIEFRSADSGALVDAGTVRMSGSMSMPGMLMSSDIEVRPSGTPGRYTGSASFGMAGAWRMSIEWDGPAGRGSTSFEGKVQ
jgi:Cu(I)/Ag(I) efflux system membrane protein CusA/SilA